MLAVFLTCSPAVVRSLTGCTRTSLARWNRERACSPRPLDSPSAWPCLAFARRHLAASGGHLAARWHGRQMRGLGRTARGAGICKSNWRAANSRPPWQRLAGSPTFTQRDAWLVQLAEAQAQAGGQTPRSRPWHRSPTIARAARPRIGRAKSSQSEPHRGGVAGRLRHVDGLDHHHGQAAKLGRSRRARLDLAVQQRRLRRRRRRAEAGSATAKRPAGWPSRDWRSLGRGGQQEPAS